LSRFFPRAPGQATFYRAEIANFSKSTGSAFPFRPGERFLRKTGAKRVHPDTTNRNLLISGWVCLVLRPDFVSFGIRIMNDDFEASCLCGGVRLRYSGKLGPSNYCHCEDCRRANGSAFNIGVRVDRKDLEVTTTTELKSYKSANDRGREIVRCFCGTCGSPIFTLHPDKPDYAWVKAGILRQPEIVRPTYENWIRDKVQWAVIDVPESNEESKKV
jgi:hypothetical protein